VFQNTIFTDLERDSLVGVEPQPVMKMKMKIHQNTFLIPTIIESENKMCIPDSDSFTKLQFYPEI